MQNHTQTKNQDHSITLIPEDEKFSLIWLHGRGDKCERFVPFFKNNPLFLNFRVQLLQAPLREIGVNATSQHAWYDIKSYDRFSGDEKQVFNFDHIEQTMTRVDKEVKKQAEYLKGKLQINEPFKRIFIAGFSQGAVMSLFYGLDSKEVLGGICAFGGYMLKSSNYKNKGKVPILLLHGEKDSILIESECKETYEKLLEDKENTKYIALNDLDHTVDEQQVRRYGEWITQIINK